MHTALLHCRTELSPVRTLPPSSPLRLIGWAALGLLPSCLTAPSYPLPEPLPEVLEWSAGQEQAGNFLGLEVRENDSDSLEDLFFEPGVKVTRVVANSPAAQAGFKVGDVLLQVGEFEVNDPGALDTLIDQAAVGVDLTLRASRGDSAFDVHVQLVSEGTAGPAADLVWRRDPARTRAGWLTAGGGARLVSMDPEGPVARANIEVGSVVKTLDSVPVHSARSLIRKVQALPEGTTVSLGVIDRQGNYSEVRVVLLDVPRRVLDFDLPFLINYTSNADGSVVSLSLLDAWIIWLMRYERTELEEHWSFLRFIRFSSGVGELGQ